jgi:hypothetical protein
MQLADYSQKAQKRLVFHEKHTKEKQKEKHAEL